MVKKRKIKKKPVFILLLVIVLICFGLYGLVNLGGGKIQNNLTRIGYKEDEVKIIMNKVPSINYFLSTMNITLRIKKVMLKIL